MSSEESPDGPPDGVPPEVLAAAHATARKAARRKLVGVLLVTAISVGASVLSCVGQSFSMRQARALEGIERHLEGIEARCGR